MPNKRYIYECDQCGACCTLYRINLNEEDKRRLSLVLLPSEVDQGYFDTGEADDWSGRIGCRFQSEYGACKIQTDKPKCCSDYEPGSTGCQWARGKAGLSPLYPIETITIGEQR